MANASFSVSNSLYLVQQTVSSKVEAAKPVEVATNHTLVIDCSGSMSWELPKIREQLKKKLPKILGEKDVISIIWFSSRGQCGVLLEAEPVATLADLSAVNAAIDRWLKPVAMTGFKDPIELAGQLVTRVSKARPDAANSLIFLSDGCDNQSSRPEILKAVETAAKGFQAATFVEYGYYADRPLLTAMAEKAGGALIFSEDFDRYQPMFEAALGKKLSGAKKIDITIPGDPIGGFAFSVVDGDLLTYAVESGVAQVPEDAKEVFYLSPSSVGKAGGALTDMAKANSPLSALAAGYAATSLYATRMQPNVVFALLKALGDVQYVEQFSSCFGKQKYSEFQEAAKVAAFDSKLRFLKGYDPDKVPREDSYTVLQLLQLLSEESSNRILMDHPKFKYSKIGRGRLDSNSVLTQEEQDEIEKLTTEMIGVRDAKKVAELNLKIAAIMNSKKPPLKFVNAEAKDGYPVDALVYNEERPNISLRVRKEGTVDLSTRIPSELKGAISPIFPTFVFRNYTIVKDGLVNVEVLPVSVGLGTLSKIDKLIKDGFAPKELLTTDDGVLLLNLKSLPAINRQMVKTASAKTLFTLEWELTKARAAQKVFKDYKDKLAGKRESEGFKSKYGEDATKWLAEQGLTDYSGFNPKGVVAESTDFYMGKEMAVSLKSFSSLPTVKEVREKMAALVSTDPKIKAKAKPLTPSASIMAPYITELETFLASEEYKTGKADLVVKLDKAAKDSVSKVRGLIFEKAQLLFSIVVGQTWFSEFSSLEENSMDLTLDGQTLSCKVEMNEIQVKI